MYRLIGVFVSEDLFNFGGPLTSYFLDLCGRIIGQTLCYAITLGIETIYSSPYIEISFYRYDSRWKKAFTAFHKGFHSAFIYDKTPLRTAAVSNPSLP